MAEINGNYSNPYSYGYNNNQAQQNYYQAQDPAYPALTAYNPGMDTVNFGNYPTEVPPEPEKKSTGKTLLKIGAAIAGVAIFVGTKGRLKASGKTLTVFKKVAGEGAERTVKKGVSELAENAGKKAVEQATKKAGTELSKEAAEQIAKEAQEKVINNYAKSHVALFSKEGMGEVWKTIRHPLQTRQGIKSVKQADEELKAASKKWREVLDSGVDKNSPEYLEALKNKEDAAVKLMQAKNYSDNQIKNFTKNMQGNAEKVADATVKDVKNVGEEVAAETVKSKPNATMTTNADGSKSIKIIKDGKETNINRVVEYKDGKWTVTDKNLETGDVTVKNYDNKNLINAKAEKSKAFSDYHKLKDDPNYNANELKNNALNADKKLKEAENYEKSFLDKQNKMVEDAKKLELENKKLAEEETKKAAEQAAAQPQPEPARQVDYQDVMNTEW